VIRREDGIPISAHRTGRNLRSSRTGTSQKNNGRAEALPLPVKDVACPHAKRPGPHEVLLGGEFFLFAFHPHLLELTLLSFNGCRNLLLDLGCRLFQLR